MNVFNNVSTQMSGLGSSLGSWFKKEGKEEDIQATESTGANNEQSSPQGQDQPPAAPVSHKSVKRSGDENEDAGSQHSGATEGADSNPPSEPEEEGAEGKAGFTTVAQDVSLLLEGLTAFNLSGVSSRASASAKSVGSFFSTAFSKAGASVKEAGTRIKETVEKNTLLTEFNKEQEAFIKAKGGKTGQAVAPWVGYPQEDTLKEEIMALSTDRRNFVRSPPQGVSFEFELEQFLPVAEATLAADPNLDKMRFELVPKVVNEENFWRNYFYRVGLIRQSTELSSLEKENPQDSTTAAKNESEVNKASSRGPKPKDEEVDQSEPSQGTESEFVSDSFQPSSKDVEEVKKGVSDLTKTSGEEDWEAELREELGEELNEYEVVGGANKDNDQWEEELQNMIDDEDLTDLR